MLNTELEVGGGVVDSGVTELKGEEFQSCTELVKQRSSATLISWIIAKYLIKKSTRSKTFSVSKFYSDLNLWLVSSKWSSNSGSSDFLRISDNITINNFFVSVDNVLYEITLYDTSGRESDIPLISSLTFPKTSKL